MKRQHLGTAALLAPAAVLAMTVSGAAAAPGHHHHHRYPASQGWTAVDATYQSPAGHGCQSPTTAHVTGHERVVVRRGHRWVPVTDPDWTATYGDTYRLEAPDEVFRLADSAKPRHAVFRRIDGTFTEHVNRDGSLRGIGRGRNLYNGPHVRGVLWTEGVQWYTEPQVVTEPTDTSVTLTRIRGHREELCRRIGLRPALPTP